MVKTKSSKKSRRLSWAAKAPRKHRINRTDSVSGNRADLRAAEHMSMEELQRIARACGIPIGGLRKTQLIRKINTYN